jgi:hypothetical protein
VRHGRAGEGETVTRTPAQSLEVERRLATGPLQFVGFVGDDQVPGLLLGPGQIASCERVLQQHEVERLAAGLDLDAKAVDRLHGRTVEGAAFSTDPGITGTPA